VFSAAWARGGPGGASRAIGSPIEPVADNSKKVHPLLGARSFLSVLTTKFRKSGAKMVRTDTKVNVMVKSDAKMGN
jgi:hypothetical protein